MQLAVDWQAPLTGSAARRQREQFAHRFVGFDRHA